MKVVLYTSDQRQVEYDPQRGGFQPWQAIPCLRCGTCCTKWQPPLDREEIETIAKGLGMTQEEFYRDYVQEYPPRPGTYLLRRKNNACVFLKYENDQATCLIHSFKPAACRSWTPSLSRRECQEGLRKRRENGLLVLPQELYSSNGELAAFCRSLHGNNKG